MYILVLVMIWHLCDIYSRYRGNNFTSEPIPSCLSSLHKLEALFLANCNLKGPIPEWIGQLTELRQLDLQRNNLRGPIPSSIGKLKNILYLNFKDNSGLNGPLPVGALSRLVKLNRLSLVHCNFTPDAEALHELQSKLPRYDVMWCLKTIFFLPSMTQVTIYYLLLTVFMFRCRIWI